MNSIAIVNFIIRIGNAILDAINKKRAKDAANDPADNLSGDGVVQQSDKSFADLASKSESDQAER